MSGISIIRTRKPKYTTAIEYDAANNPIYVGEAEPGIGTSDPRWRIRRIDYDALNNAIAVLWASGNGNFDKAWDLRNTYTYS